MISAADAVELKAIMNWDGASEYLPVLVHNHRTSLRISVRSGGAPFLPNHYKTYEGVVYPEDIQRIEGIWLESLPSFTNLVVLDMDINLALFWLLPILGATTSTFLRRICLRNTDDFFQLSMRFPAVELDLVLDEDFPLTKIILLFPTPASINYFSRKMVLCNYKGFIGVVKIGLSIASAL